MAGSTDINSAGHHVATLCVCVCARVCVWLVNAETRLVTEGGLGQWAKR